MSNPSCEYCGRCLSVCPSYRHFLVETMSPRARIDLARAVEKGEFTPTPRYAQSLAGCLQCLACTDICGKGVDGAQVVLHARLRQQAAAGALTPGRRVERWVTSALLPRRGLLTRLVRVLARVQGLLPLEGRGTVRHLPDALCALAGRRSLPPLARRSLFELLPPRVLPPEGVTARGEVALFTGCFGGVVGVEPALALVRRLAECGYTVHVPPAQSCCGAPALLSGFGDAFGRAQAHNARVFAEQGNMPLLTLCATCHRTLTREYEDSGRELAGRVMDAALFLHQAGAPAPLLPQRLPAAWAGGAYSAENPLRVAVHDPCHLRLNPDTGRALRAQLAARPWVEVVELPEPGSCCGGGGISSLKNADVADALGNARARHALAAGVQAVVAQCPGCVLQLNNHLSRLQTSVRACHAAELLGA